MDIKQLKEHCEKNIKYNTATEEHILILKIIQELENKENEIALAIADVIRRYEESELVKENREKDTKIEKLESSWQKLRETLFAIMHYTNGVNATELLKGMEELEDIGEISLLKQDSPKQVIINDLNLIGNLACCKMCKNQENCTSKNFPPSDVQITFGNSNTHSSCNYFIYKN